MKVSHMAEHIIGSEIIKLASEIKSRKAAGEHIFNLTIGDFNPDIFPIPVEFKEEIIRAYGEGITNYPASNGMAELRDAVSDYLNRTQGLAYEPDNILISSGARPLIFATYLTLIDPGDTIIFPVPSWNNNHYTHISGANPIMVHTNPEDNFMPSAEVLAPHVKGATLVALCSPLNPTGTVFSKEQLAGICELILEENNRRGPDEKPLYLLFDQIYSNLTYGETQHVDPVSLYPEMRAYTIFIDGMSKAFAATGVRVGWGFGPEHVIRKMRSILSHAGTWSPKAEQVAASRYLSNKVQVDAYLVQIREQLNARLLGFYEGINQLKAKGFAVDAISPQAALYLTVKFDLVGMKRVDGTSLDTHADVHRYLIDEAKVALVPFGAFGAEDSPWYRLSVGTARLEEIPQVIQQLGDAIGKLAAVPASMG
ncbi:MAG: aminotransferase class I/II-fold pyridoxal phosphate-dependent enzyme [Bacteroidota bacterium]